ncbi:Dihydrolipoyl dehydrogenase, mitochondrial [Sphaceloma murrayae]|uniref:Dihydrolipoyl dehydrogenase, mitochondrial n=1 Tax=Sphaceloma murrayae TaxID=2082308 RepID=A0A2K1QG54_9PEZI|nr:Dihydrolipoyl dehydrogenase, mitochondrial [Sphaceloma murrayae]
MATEFKVKDLTSVNLKNGQKQEVEVEGIEGGKVLLVKLDDQVHALNSNCTHYGAPLAKGVLTPEGRLTCPWHGACFNARSGDVEDAPALDPLHRFKVTQKDGAVYISGEEKQIKDQRRKLSIKCSPKKQEKLVVVGGGAGAIAAIEALRSGGYESHITMITREGVPPIDRTKLSKALMTDASKVAWRDEAYFKEGGVDMVYDEVTSASLADRKISTKSGKTYDYTKLILASGGTPRFLPLEGLKGDLKNVFVIRELSHTQEIMKAAGSEGGKKVVVIGSSFIGMEVGNALAGMKHDVTIIGMESAPMERVMGSKVGAIFQKLLEKNGVKFLMDASVDKASPSKSDSSFVGSVHLKDGTTLEADLVIEGVGVRPSTDYLSDSKEVKLEKDGSLSVDEHFAVPGQKDVYAIGDIATYPYHGPSGKGKPVRIEHWDVAQNAGRVVASHMLHGTKEARSSSRNFIPVFWSAVGAQLRYCGNTPNGYDDVILQGKTDPDGPSWVAYYTLGEEVVAVASMMKDPYMTQSAELMRRGAMPSKKELQGGKDIMEVDIPIAARI